MKAVILNEECECLNLYIRSLQYISTNFLLTQYYYSNEYINKYICILYSVDQCAYGCMYACIYFTVHVLYLTRIYLCCSAFADHPTVVGSFRSNRIALESVSAPERPSPLSYVDFGGEDELHGEMSTGAVSNASSSSSSSLSSASSLVAAAMRSAAQVSVSVWMPQ